MSENVSKEPDVDALLTQIYEPTTPREQGTEIGEGGAKPETIQKDPFDFEDEIQWGKEKKKFHYNDIKRYAQMGYAFNENQRKLNNERQEWTKKEKTLSEQLQAAKALELYRDVDEYAKKNPKWWDHILQSYQAGGQVPQEQSQEAPPPWLEKLTAMEKRIAELSGDFSTIKDERERVRKDAEDKTLDTEIEEYRKAHPYFDWKALNETGYPALEVKILEHAAANGIKKFSTAANDFLHDEFIKRTDMKAREEVGKTVQTKNKLGLGEVRTEPRKNMAATDTRNKSYDQLAREALKELGIGG